MAPRGIWIVSSSSRVTTVPLGSFLSAMAAASPCSSRSRVFGSARLSATWIEGNKPVLGIWLGAQLIASALGARVYQNPQKEIGWLPIEAVPTSEGAFVFPPVVPVFHWHGETFDLPPDAVRLAQSLGCENQAFQVGRQVMGLQFHLETTPTAADAILTHCRHELVDGPYIQAEAVIRSVPSSTYHRVNALMAEVLDYLARDVG